MSNVIRLDLKRARHLWEAGQAQAACPQYAAYLRVEPDDAQVLREYGRALMEVGEYKVARRAWRKLRTLIVADAETEAQLGICLLYEDRAEDALRLFEKALRVQPDNLSIQFAVAGALTHLGRDEDALPYFDFVTRHAPDQAEGAYLEWACALSRLERHERALAVTEEGLDIHQESAELHYCRSLCLGALNRLEESVESLRHTIDCDIDHVGAWRLMARMDDDVEHVLPKLFCWQRLFELLPDDGEVALELAMAAHDQRHLECALSASERAVLLQPKNVLALHLRAIVLKAVNDFDGACDMLRRACRIEPDNAYVLPDYGAALLATGHYGQAERVLRRALALCPEDQASRENLGLAQARRAARSRTR